MCVCLLEGESQSIEGLESELRGENLAERGGGPVKRNS